MGTPGDSLVLLIGVDAPSLLVIIIIIIIHTTQPLPHSQPFLLSSERCQCRQVSLAHIILRGGVEKNVDLNRSRAVSEKRERRRRPYLFSCFSF